MTTPEGQGPHMPFLYPITHKQRLASAINAMAERREQEPRSERLRRQLRERNLFLRRIFYTVQRVLRKQNK